ncbi:MAG: DUF2267 domain-containing protein [Polaromonas sp.]
MTLPPEYQRASQEFEKFMVDARDISGLATTSMAYTMVQGVLQAFRRRLNVREAALFANVLPAVVRAIFVADWNTDEPQRAFEDRATMTKEVQSLRAAHNFAPDTAIQDVAKALRQNIDQAALDRVLAELPQGAAQFWHP